MKRAIIKNWIKYWTGILAVSGLLIMGACDNQQQTAETDEGIPERENVNRGPEGNEYIAEDADQPVTVEEDTAAQMDEQETTQTQYERTGNVPQGTDRSASPIQNIDSHLDEHEEVNDTIRQVLTETDANRANIPGEENTTTATENPQTDRNIYDRQEDDTAVDQNQQGTTTDQTRQEDTQQQQTTFGTENETQTEQTQDKLETNQQRPTTDQSRQEDTQQQQTTFGTENETQTEQNQDNMNTDQQRATTDPTQQQNTLDNDTQIQDTTAVGGEDEQDLNMLIIERYRMVDPQELSEEERQRMEQIMAEYTRRQESMRGQRNPETGAYISPETEARPSQGIESIQEQIRNEITYPQNAIAGGIEGIVFVRFVVDENGNVTQAKAVEEVLVADPENNMAMESLGQTNNLDENELEAAKEELKQEAIRAVEATSGQWEAGEHGGQSVPTEVQLPVQFQLNAINEEGNQGPVND